jgi:large subunit ribosomal protein L29
MKNSAEEYVKMLDDELDVALKNSIEELFNLRFRNINKQLSNPLEIRKVKKKIARIKTVLHQRELEAKKK